MKKVLVTCALSVEMKVIKEEIKTLDIKGLKISFLLTGVGNYNTIYSLKDYIDKKGKPDFLINIGVCGKSDDKVSNDFFQVYRIKNTSNLRESLLPIYIENNNLKSILSSEKVILNKEDMLGEEYVDMESYAIDYIANKEKIAGIIIKKPFDTVGNDSKNIDLEELKDSLKDFDYKKLLEEIYNWLDKNKSDNSEKYLEKIKNHLKLTFSEFEILKKSYNKSVALKLDFKGFYKENKSLEKKDFFKKIKDL